MNADHQRRWKRIGRIALAAGTLLVAACACAAGSAQGQVMKWTVKGVEREALIIAPSNAAGADVKAPVVFAFHGHGGNMQQVADAGVQQLWPEAIFVYPQGLPTKLYVDPE